jgi:ABC-type lipoprotein release transport system permease subunit
MRVLGSRQALLLDYALSGMARRAGRNAAVLAAYAGVVFLLASVSLCADALRREARTLLAHGPEVLVQKLEAGRHAFLTRAEIAPLEAIRGVGAVEGRRWGYLHDDATGANYTLMAPGTDPVPPGKVRIGDGVARLRGVREGDLLSLRSPSGVPFALAVERVFADESSLIAADLVLVSGADWTAFFRLPADLLTDAALSVPNPAEAGTVAGKAAAAIPGSRVILRDDLLRTYAALFDWREGLLLALAGMSVLSFALLAWSRAAVLSADERREIGILKAVGWETRDVLAARLWEGGLVSGGAFLLGFSAAWLHVFHFGAVLVRPVLAGWSVLYPSFSLRPALDAATLLSLVLLTVLPYTLATLVPAWRAAAADPDEAMRGAA